MKCANCGGDIVNGRCAVCGQAPVAEPGRQNSGGGSRGMNTPPPGPAVFGGMPLKQPVSVIGWIGRMLLPWIPIVGGIVTLIMYIVWACSDKFEESSKNWAIASLIMVAVNLILTIIFVVIIILIFTFIMGSPELQRELELYLNGI